MTQPEVELRNAWHHVAGREHDHLLDHLLGRYREPQRRYHTATHVMWVLRHVSALAAEPDPAATPTDLAAVQLAALFHDAVYDPRANDNEARSADLAVRCAGELGWSTDRCQLVHRLVMATATHTSHDVDEATLVDADLAILGAEPNDYSAYVHGVRSEYAHVSEAQWRVGRTDVLRSLLAVPHLYRTAAMRDAREARARANLTAELATLGS